MTKEGRPNNPLYSAFAYDDAFRTMETECDDILIPFVNYIFGESYDEHAQIRRMRNEHFWEHQDHSDQKRITDAHFTITQDGISKSYHMECESQDYDGTVLVRFFEYDAQIAIADSAGVANALKVRIPHGGLLLLGDSSKVKSDVLEVIIETPEESMSYHIKVIRIGDFSIDSIFEKKLYMLIPFYIFNYKMELDDIDADADRIAALADLYKGIINRLDAEQESGRLSSKSHGVIIRLTHKVIYKIMEKYNNAREKVGDVMGGEVLDLPEIRAYNEGKAEGRAEGKAEGQAERDALEAENERLKQEIERLRAASV